ncbi:MAG: hypothetical protein KJP00_15125 [Bacteroidia bacterium]|nr:hypothetical protein [Bacteroidia bacterium]
MKTKILYILSVLITLSLIGCSGPKHLLKVEDYDASIAKTIKKMRGARKRVKVKHAELLYEAFSIAHKQSLTRIKRLEKAKRPSSWIEINDLYNDIIERQSLVQPYVHYAESYGLDMRGLMRDYSVEEYESRKRAGHYLYTNASEMLNNARIGDKIAARRAYNDLVLLDSFFERYKDKDQLKREAITLGTDHILVRVANVSGGIFPRNIARRVMDFEVEQLNDLFHRYYIKETPDIAFDYKIRINLLDLDVSPESNSLNTYQDTKEVPDGFEYVLDTNGNVMKDSLGNDIKVNKTKFISATIEEIYQFKAVGISGNVEYFDMYGDRIISTRPIQAEAVFENYAATFRGEREALSSESQNKIGNLPVPYPQTEDLLKEAVEQLKPIILTSIKRMKIS